MTPLLYSPVPLSLTTIQYKATRGQNPNITVRADNSAAEKFPRKFPRSLPRMLYTSTPLHQSCLTAWSQSGHWRTAIPGSRLKKSAAKNAAIQTPYKCNVNIFLTSRPISYSTGPCAFFNRARNALTRGLKTQCLSQMTASVTTDAIDIIDLMLISNPGEIFHSLVN